MESIGSLDPVAARQHAEGQDGPRSAVARQRQDERGRPAVTFGGALSHLNGFESEINRVDPIATGDRVQAKDIVRARAVLTESLEDEGQSVRQQRLAEERDAYAQRRDEKSARPRYDLRA
jgi:hypothetical protein